MKTLNTTSNFRRIKFFFLLSLVFSLFNFTDAFSQSQGTIESFAVANSGSTDNRTPIVNKPASLAVNDLLLINVWWRGSTDGTADITPPTGYTAIATRRSNQINMTTFYKLATATEVAASNLTFTNLFSSNVSWGISATRVSGVNQNLPITNISTNFSNSNTTTHSLASSITPNVNNSLVLGYFAADRDRNYSPNNNFDEIYEATRDDGSSRRSIGTLIATKQGSSTATNVSTTISNQQQFVGIGFAVNMNTSFERPCFPVYNINSLSGSGSGINSSRFTQIFNPTGTINDIHIRYTFVNRSNTSVSIDDWDAADGTSGYGNFWQPVIEFNSGTSITDTAWAEFLVEFSGSSASNNTNFINNRKTIPCLALTIVDLDGGGTGSNALREMVQVTESSMAFDAGTSAITYGNIGPWTTLISGTTTYPSIDSTITVAMAQINFEDVQTYRIRLGILGARGAATQRQFSLRFISYDNFTTPLPVTYSYFNAKPSNNKVQLEWETTSEINNSHFEIEKTIDGENWYTIGTVEGAGNSYGSQFYSFDDNSPSNGLNVYRLKQVDWNGEYEYSSNKSVIWGGETFVNNVNVYPNPSNGKIFISGVEKPKVTVYNMVGSVLFQSENMNELDLQELLKGVYFINVQNAAGEVSRIRFIKE